MKLLKTMGFFLIFILIVSGGYFALAWCSDSWHQDLNMDTTYSYGYYEDKVKAIIREMEAQPLEVTALNVTEKECEGLLKLAVAADEGIAPYIKGLGLSVQQNKLVVKVNVQAGTWKKGFEVTFVPCCNEKTRELAVKMERIKMGPYPLPASPVLFLLEKVVPVKGPIRITDNQVRMSINNVPVALKYVRTESKQLIAGLSLATGELTKIATGDKNLIKEVFSKAEVLQKGLISTQVIDFISEMQQKNEITAEDIEKGKAIYNSLSPEDKVVLHRNLRLFLKDPSVEEAMQKFGLQ